MDHLPKIIELRKQGMTYQAIGDVLGVKRQRIHQIYKGYRPGDGRRTRLYFVNCSVCGKKGSRKYDLASTNIVCPSCYVYKRNHKINPDMPRFVRQHEKKDICEECHIAFTLSGQHKYNAHNRCRRCFTAYVKAKESGDIQRVKQLTNYYRGIMNPRHKSILLTRNNKLRGNELLNSTTAVRSLDHQ